MQIKKNKYYSEDIDITDYWRIIPREWEVNEFIFKVHSSPSFHLKTKPTCKQIEENGYKWNNIEKSVREFYLNCEVCHQISQNPKKCCSKSYFILKTKRKICNWSCVFIRLFCKWK